MLDQYLEAEAEEHHASQHLRPLPRPRSDAAAQKNARELQERRSRADDEAGDRNRPTSSGSVRPAAAASMLVARAETSKVRRKRRFASSMPGSMPQSLPDHAQVEDREQSKCQLMVDALKDAGESDAQCLTGQGHDALSQSERDTDASPTGHAKSAGGALNRHNGKSIHRKSAGQQDYRKQSSDFCGICSGMKVPGGRPKLSVSTGLWHPLWRTARATSRPPEALAESAWQPPYWTIIS
ncbi:hypothetical protein SH591_13945 [Sphingomonas sp. LY54]|nr:hypothetical protein [Sphingomonas sp. LY54]WRP28190.1 hypothetical protein SH591_13945 [Sphingomonas sp. LY54]